MSADRKVIPFPVPKDTTGLTVHPLYFTSPKVFTVYHCSGNCDALVSSAGAYCLTCASQGTDG